MAEVALSDLLQLGRAFGRDWAGRSTPEEHARVLENEPHLPVALDRELRDFAHTHYGHDRDVLAEEEYRALAQGFYQALRAP
jgi:hypothetical protein